MRLRRETEINQFKKRHNYTHISTNLFALLLDILFIFFKKFYLTIFLITCIFSQHREFLQLII